MAHDPRCRYWSLRLPSECECGQAEISWRTENWQLRAQLEREARSRFWADMVPVFLQTLRLPKQTG